MKAQILCYVFIFSVLFVDLSFSSSEESDNNRLYAICFQTAICADTDRELDQKTGTPCFNEIGDKGKEYFLKTFSETFSENFGSLQSVKDEICPDSDKYEEHIKFSGDIYKNVSAIMDKERKTEAEEEISKFKVCVQDYVNSCEDYLHEFFKEVSQQRYTDPNYVENQLQIDQNRNDYQQAQRKADREQRKLMRKLQG